MVSHAIASCMAVASDQGNGSKKQRRRAPLAEFKSFWLAIIDIYIQISLDYPLEKQGILY